MGDFVGEELVLFSMRSGLERPEPQKRTGWPMLSYVSIDQHRNIKQDLAFMIQQLVDVTLKALSPGINDTTTAIIAVDYLGAIGQQLARREFPARLRSDETYLRVLVRAADFEDYIRLAFDLPRITCRVLAAVGAVASSCGRMRRRP